MCEGRRGGMTSEERVAYARAVIKAVYGVDAEEARVSQREWEVLSSWMDKETPLRTVLQVVENMQERGQGVKSLRYLRPIVEEEEKRRKHAVRVG